MGVSGSEWWSVRGVFGQCGIPMGVWEGEAIFFIYFFNPIFRVG